MRALRDALYGLFILAMTTGMALAKEADAAQPSEVLLEFLGATYARDFAVAYRWISPRDRALKSASAYLQENRPLEGEALEFSRFLASMIVIQDVQTNIKGERATVSFKAALPDANAGLVRELTEDFDSAALRKLSVSERERRRNQLSLLASQSRLPVIHSPGEEWELERVGGRWWVKLDWGGAVRVRFDAATMAGLPLQFEPATKEIRALPGETLQVVYRLRNPTGKTITAKARHVVAPEKDRKHFDIVTCFCFLEQTLHPGEAVELPVIFRVSYDVPQQVERIDVRYELYPRQAFPRDTGS